MIGLPLIQSIGQLLRWAFSYSCLVIGIFSGIFGLIVWFKGSRQPVQWLWLIFCLAVGAWSFSFGMMTHSQDFKKALLWQEWCMYMGAILIPAVFLHFVMLIVRKRSPFILFINYMVVAVLVIENAAHQLVYLQPNQFFPYYTCPAKLFNYFTIYFFCWILYAHLLLIRGLFQMDAWHRNQIKFILLGTSIGFLGGSTSFFMTYRIPLFPYGVYAVPIYILTVSYAIFKHQLMDITIVIRRTLLYSLLSTVLAAVYVGTITLMVRALGERPGSISAASSALAAILIALLFNPFRLRIQRGIDRYFPREKLDPALLQEAAGSFAHEMKRPLSKISLPAELALMDLERVKKGESSWVEIFPALEERLHFILGQSMDAGYLVEAIRELSAFPISPLVSVDLEQLIETILMAEKNSLAKNNIRVERHWPKEWPRISARPKLMEIVFVNLIKNAVEAMSELLSGIERVLTFEGKLANDKMVIKVMDTGAGIPAEQQSKLFMPNRTTKGPRGTGLGLYLSNQILQFHGGTLRLQSQEGNGSSFSVVIPVALK